MWVSRLLFGSRHFPGKMWSGKNKKIRKVTGYMLRNRERRANLVEEVEKIIAVPYLSQEEDMGHAVEKKQEQWEAIKARKRKGLGPDVLGLNSEHSVEGYKSFLEHLNVAKAWTPNK